MAAFEQTQRDRHRLLHLQRLYLEQWLDRAEQQWEDESIRQACITTWQQSIKALWEVYPPPVRIFCANLALAVKRLAQYGFQGSPCFQGLLFPGKNAPFTSQILETHKEPR